MLSTAKLYDASLEQIIIGCILLDGNKLFEDMIGILDERDFYKTEHQRYYKILRDMYKKGIPIDLSTVAEYISNTQTRSEANFTYLIHCINSVPTTANLSYYVKTVKDYSYKRMVMHKIEKFKMDEMSTEKLVEDIINTPKYEEIKEKTNREIILETIEDANRGMDFKFPENFDDVNRIIGGLDRGDLVIIGGYPSNGKCLKKGTKVVMYNGKLEKVEDIKVGDLLMGIDSTPRKVLSLHSGTDDLYIIRQYKGMDYVVNSRHLLSLKKSNYSKKYKNVYPNSEKIINIPINEFNLKSDSFKRNFLGYRVGVEFNKKNIRIDPYFLGLWLGDGSSSETTITTKDKEIKKYIYRYANKLDLKISRVGKNSSTPSYHIAKRRIRGEIDKGIYFEKSYKNKEWLRDIYSKKRLSIREIAKLCKVSYETIRYWLIKNNINRRPNIEKNKLEKWFIKYNLINDKHIPDDYLYNTRKVRIRVLAGLIDTDGNLNCNGYEIVQKNKTLSYQIYYLASSLGFRCSIKKVIGTINETNFKGEYYRMFIHGNTQDIPVLVERKKIKKYNKSRNPCTTGIKIEYYGIGEYYGFALDKDGLFLLEDFTVIHNSSLMTELIVGFCNQGYRVLVTTLEMSPKANMRRLEANMNKINTMKFRTNSLTELDKERIKAIIPIVNDAWNYNCVRVYTIADIIRATNKFEPDLLFIDYLQNISEPHEKLRLYEKATKHTLQIQQFTKEKNIVTFLLSQFHRPTEGQIHRPHNSDLRDSGAIEERADIIFLIYWERKLKMESLYRVDGDAPEYMEVNITKSKDGATGGLGYNFYPEYHRWVNPNDDRREPIIYKRAKEVSGEYYKTKKEEEEKIALRKANELPF